MGRSKSQPGECVCSGARWEQRLAVLLQAMSRKVRLRDLHATFVVGVMLMGLADPYGIAQQAKPGTPTNPSRGDTSVPPAPQPNYTQPLFLRPGQHDYSNPKKPFPTVLAPYTAAEVEAPRLSNTPRLDELVRDGKIYLSLDDAVMLALENNFDIAIARYNLDIADTDLLRAKAGQSLRGVSTGLVTGTEGGTGTTVTSGGGPGGTTTGAASAGTGASGLVLSTNGGGPLPEPTDPVLTGTLEHQRQVTPESTTFITGTNSLTQATNSYNFGYQEGFTTGTLLNVTFDNSRSTNNSTRSTYSPQLSSTFQAQLTQHLLQGCCLSINRRFIVQAKNNRRITDSSFRQQLLYTVNQIENIYWGLVSAYEDLQSKQRALAQSQALAADNRKQLQIGTLAPLDVINSDASVASDQQALIQSQTNLEYQQLVMKQAISRNLDDPKLSNAAVIPTDRVSLVPTAEEGQKVEDLVQSAYANRPDIEQAVINLKNDEITLKGERNGLLPTVDLFGFYGGAGLGGSQSPYENCNPSFTSGAFVPCTGPNAAPTIGYGTVFQNLFNNAAPNRGFGLNVTIPIRNRTAQADQARSVLEYRQAQMRLQQLYVQARIAVINGVYAITNDRALVQSAQVARSYAAQSLEAEQRKYKLGASTTANVLQQERNLATAENTLIANTAAYGRDRAALSEILANTLDKYGINLADSAAGRVNQAPNIPGLEAPKPPPAAAPLVPGQAPPPPQSPQPPPPLNSTQPQNQQTPQQTVPQGGQQQVPQSPDGQQSPPQSMEQQAPGTGVEATQPGQGAGQGVPTGTEPQQNPHTNTQQNPQTNTQQNPQTNTQQNPQTNPQTATPPSQR